MITSNKGHSSIVRKPACCVQEWLQGPTWLGPARERTNDRQTDAQRKARLGDLGLSDAASAAPGKLLCLCKVRQRGGVIGYGWTRGRDYYLHINRKAGFLVQSWIKETGLAKVSENRLCREEIQARNIQGRKLVDTFYRYYQLPHTDQRKAVPLESLIWLWPFQQHTFIQDLTHPGLPQFPTFVYI